MQRDLASTSINLDKILRCIPPRQLALEQPCTFPNKAALAISDVAWNYLREINPATFELVAPDIRQKFCRYLIHQFERTGCRVFETRAFRFFSDERSATNLRSISEALCEYKGLARIWNAQLMGWCAFVGDFFAHTTTFLHNYRFEQTPDGLADLQTGLSDPHHGGRSVTHADFTNAGDWFYKPRSGNREAAWSHLLGTLNSAGFDPAFFIPEVRPASDHCWMRAVPHFMSRSENECRRFHHRTGCLLYLAHILRAVDLHAANFINHGDQPVLIDPETLFHPETNMPLAARIEEHSLARTGMLSSYNSVNGNPFIDLSRQWQSTFETSPRTCRQGRDNDELLAGFEAMHHFLHHTSEDRHIWRAIRTLRWSGTRCLFRPTHLYYNLLYEALTPWRSRSVTDLSRFLRSRLDDGLCKPDIVRKEVQQLLNGDIPTFTARPAPARHLLDKGDFGRAIKSLRNWFQRT